MQWDSLFAARKFISVHGDNVRYVAPFKKWFVWTGSHWEVDTLNKTFALLADTIHGMHYNEGAALLASGDKDQYLAFTRFVVTCGNRLDHILKVASAQEDIRVNTEWLDRTAWYLNTPSGTVDLRDGSVSVWAPTDLITKETTGAYLPKAQAPTWDAFLSEVLPDPAVREYVQRLVGYTLLGASQERIMVFLHGTGRNGKSVFIETLREVLGSYSMGTPVQTFLQKNGNGGASNDLARLRGARFICASEFEEGAKANIALLKQVTGDDIITARFLYGEYFDFRFEGTVWISTNHMPFVGSTQAVWDRVKIIDFATRISEQHVDIHLKEKLLKERDGILNWAVTGAINYQAHGFGEPVAVTEKSMTLRWDQSILAAFFEELCEMDNDYRETATGLYQAYQYWCMGAGEKQMSKKMFGIRLQEAGYQSYRTAAARFWSGLRLKAKTNA